VGVGAIVRRTATIILKGYTEYLHQCILVPKTIYFSFCDDSFLIFSYAYAWQSYDAFFFYHKALLNKFFVVLNKVNNIFLFYFFSSSIRFFTSCLASSFLIRSRLFSYQAIAEGFSAFLSKASPNIRQASTFTLTSSFDSL
jgi:hypothetical protein